MAEALSEMGYAETTVGLVIANAGVSRPTFYEYFADKAACFLALQQDVQRRLAAELRQSLENQPAEQAVSVALTRLLEFAKSEQCAARILMNEPMAVGSCALDVRDRGLREIEAIIEERYSNVAPETPVPDVPGRPLIGAVYRLIAAQFRNGSNGAAGLLDELLIWLRYYELPLREHRWRSLSPAAPLTRTPIEVGPLCPPGPLGNRTRLSKGEVAEHRRQRILLAAARLAEEKGYPAVTVMDITKRARVDTRAFYGLFTDKREAFRALHELLFRNIIAVTASGFSTVGSSWPERVWEAGRAFAQYMELNPTLAHASLVDSHAGDPDTVSRVDQLVGGFTIFLHEGYRYRPQRPSPSKTAQMAIAAMTFEVDYSQVRESRVHELSRLLPHMVFISLTPFLGAAEANKFIDRQLASQAAP
ncbi:MAG TPA: TetR/AcrR family transcriptional regulator [Solirubrobacteraceae bacterium]|jgi:AcrR family transcriptional regulator|nr:TetR/AcrR family transcriptional regulator [Solirubrobacteraceae bacterium]